MCTIRYYFFIKTQITTYFFFYFLTCLLSNVQWYCVPCSIVN